MASHNLLPDSMELDREAMKQVVREKGIDAVLAAHPIDRKNVESLGPGRVGYKEVVSFDPDGSFVFVASTFGYTPGVQDNLKAAAEFILYDVAARKRVWMLWTETFVTGSLRQEVAPAVDLVMGQLRADGMVP